MVFNFQANGLLFICGTFYLLRSKNKNCAYEQRDMAVNTYAGTKEAGNKQVNC
jgi:hypothetical protein